MFIVGIISWWFGAGWKRCILSVRDRLASVYDYFSIDLLLRTLFSPFRQISAEQTHGSLGARFRGLVDKLISRAVGAIMRTIVMVIGVVCLVVVVVFGALRIISWPLVPLVPAIATVLAMTGWVPWKI